MKTFRHREWRFVPIQRKDTGEVFLHDMYDKSGDWHGSRRTVEQCKLHADHCDGVYQKTKAQPTERQRQGYIRADIKWMRAVILSGKCSPAMAETYKCSLIRKWMERTPW